MAAPMSNHPEDGAVGPRQPKMERIAKDVKDIADSFSCPISEVDQLLTVEMHDLEEGARIKEFVPLLAIKRVKDRLREHHERVESGTTNQKTPMTNHADELSP